MDENPELREHDRVEHQGQELCQTLEEAERGRSEMQLFGALSTHPNSEERVLQVMGKCASQLLEEDHWTSVDGCPEGWQKVELYSLMPSR